MSLTLDAPLLTRFRDATSTLLSPLDYRDAEAWCSAVLEAMQTLMKADRSLMLVPRERGITFCSPTLPAGVLDVFRSLPWQVEAGAIRVEADEMNTVLGERRSANLEVWSNALLHRQAETPMQSTPFYHEVMVPAGVVHGRGLATSLDRGEAWLSLAYSRPADDPFGETDGLELLRLLLPAFKAGTGILARLGRHRRELGAICDRLEQPLLVYRTDGCELHRNAAFRELLARERDPESLLVAAHGLAASASAMRGRRSKTSPEPIRSCGSRQIATAEGRYRLDAVLARSGSLGPGMTVIVAIRSLSPALPQPPELIRRYGLTRREAEITLLFARGASNQRVARELGISRHTVGTHSESIFRKLGIHTRKGLGLKLLRERRPSPA